MKVKPLLEKCARLIAKAQGEKKEILKAIQSGIVDKKRIVIKEKSDNTGVLINDCLDDLGITPQIIDCRGNCFYVEI